MQRPTLISRFRNRADDSPASLDHLANLPCLHAPTVSHLYDEQWLAVETIVDASRVHALIPRLSAAGAEGILEYELRKMG
jgi:ATP phosphoribosyltransferase-like protein